MSDKFSLINMDGISNVAIKLLEMIEKSVGWVVIPKGSRVDFNDGLEIYKSELKNDTTLSSLERAAKITSARKDIIEYINKGKVISAAINGLENTAKPDNIDPDWLNHFFEYAKNISNEDMQFIWGKLLALKMNGESGISKKLIQVFSYIENEDIDIFCKICSMTFNNKNKKSSHYPFIYLTRYPSFYNDYGIRRYHLANLDNLGLVEYDVHDGFVLSPKARLLQYGSTKIIIRSDERINHGNIRLSQVGRVLYEITNTMVLDGFLDFCTEIWKREKISYDYVNE